MNYDLEGLIEQLLSNISKDEIRMPTKVDKLFGIRTTSQTSGLDINNYNNVKVIALRREVMENPNFLDKFIDKTPNKSEKQLKEEKNNLKNAILDKLKPSPIRNKGYFASLLNKYSQGYDITNKEEKKLSNVQKFNDAYVLGGPKHMLSKEQINNIHGQIDLAMKELEESGLSKEELLYDIPKGIPLKQDHFFQFVRHNKKAREMLIASTEDFSVSSVIEKALKQSLGPDPSVGAGKRDVNDPEELNDNYLFELENRKADKKYHDNYLHDDSYYYQSNKEFKNHVYMNFLSKLS